MRIAYLVPGIAVSGGTAVVCQHANRLRSRGHDVWIVAEDARSGGDWFPGQSVPVVGLGEYPGSIDILVATFWRTPFRAVHLPARQRFYFVQSDETRFHPPDSIEQYLTRVSYLLDFNYLTEARWIRTWLRDSFGHEAGLVPNGLDAKLFHPASPVVPRGTRPRILLEGPIDVPSKGMAEAFAAVEPIDAEIWCVSGGGRPKPSWRCDRFFSRVPFGDMKHVYSSCDVLLKLSRVEGFFGPPMEMMACGGTVVVGRVSGYDEYILDGVNALVVDPNDVQGARSAVQRILGDASLRAHLQRNGAATASEWRWDPSIDTLEAIFRNSLSSKRDSAPSSQGDLLNASIAGLYSHVTGIDLRSPPLPESGDGVDPAVRAARALQGRPWFQRMARLAWRLRRSRR